MTRNRIDKINKTGITRKQIWEEKEPYGYFKRQTNGLLHEKTSTNLRKRNLKRESESLLTAAENYEPITLKPKWIMHHRIASIDYVLIKTKHISHINENSKQAQKMYKARQDWVGKVINWDLYKKFKFYDTNKYYMHNPESVQDN